MYKYLEILGSLYFTSFKFFFLSIIYRLNINRFYWFYVNERSHVTLFSSNVYLENDWKKLWKKWKFFFANKSLSIHIVNCKIVDNVMYVLEDIVDDRV